MRKIRIILLCLLTPLFLQANDSLLYQNKSLSWVNAQVQAIQVPRIGVSESYIESIHNPFVFTYTVKKGHKLIHKKYKRYYRHIRPLQLMMIINNKAMINGRWYGLHNWLRGYKIVSITSTGVALKNRYKFIRLSLHKHYNNVKIHIK